MNFFQSIVQRRSFVSRFSGGAAALMVTMGGEVPPQSAISSRWQPERHKEDDWLDRVPRKHRFVFDSRDRGARPCSPGGRNCTHQPDQA